MIVVVFEVTMKEGQGTRYFDLAAALRPELAEIDGFLSVERFQSLTTPDKYASISFWRDAAAIEQWRMHEGHRLAQTLGKHEIFADFRITVAEALRSYTLMERVATAAASAR
jgi:heme-degrading monooxygenase HmoA